MKKIYIVGLSIVAIIGSYNIVSANMTDTSITKEVVEDTNKVEQQIEFPGTGYETWTLIETKTVGKDDTVGIEFTEFVESEQSSKKSFFDKNLYKIPIVSQFIPKLDVPADSNDGPPENTMLSNGEVATHRAFFEIKRGKAVYYTFRVTDRYTGQYIKTKTVMHSSDVYTLSCSQLVNIDGEYITINNADSDHTQRVLLDTYISQMEKTGNEADDYYYFS